MCVALQCCSSQNCLVQSAESIHLCWVWIQADLGSRLCQFASVMMYLYCICLHGMWDVTGGHTNFISLLYEPVVDSSVLQMYLKIGSLSCQKHTLLSVNEWAFMDFMCMVCERSLIKIIVWVCSHVLECVVLYQSLASCLTVRHQLWKRPRGNVADHPRLGGRSRWEFLPPLFDSGDGGLVDILSLLSMNSLAPLHPFNHAVPSILCHVF